MARSKKAVRFQKIPLKELILTLQSVYNQGADFIDISGIPNEQQDIIGIHVLEEYLAEEDDDENVVEKEKSNSSLSDEDLNQLI